jgi:hypothetical protein
MPPSGGGASSERVCSTGSSGSHNASISRTSETIESSIHPLLHDPSTQTKPDLDSFKAARPRRRTESLVKFADGLDTNGDPWTSNAPTPPAGSQGFQPQRQQQHEPLSSRSVRESISPLTVEDCIPSPLSETAPLLSTRPPKSSVSPRALVFGDGLKHHTDGSTDNEGRASVKQSGVSLAAFSNDTTADVNDDSELYSRWLNTTSSAISTSSSSEGQGRVSIDREAVARRSVHGDFAGGTRDLISSQSLSFSGESLSLEEAPDSAGRQLSEEEKFDLEYGVFNDRTGDRSVICRSRDDEGDHEPLPSEWIGPSQPVTDRRHSGQDVDAFVPLDLCGRSTTSNTGNKTSADPG